MGGLDRIISLIYEWCIFLKQYNAYWYDFRVIWCNSLPIVSGKDQKVSDNRERSPQNKKITNCLSYCYICWLWCSVTTGELFSCSGENRTLWEVEKDTIIISPTCYICQNNIKLLIKLFPPLSAFSVLVSVCLFVFISLWKEMWYENIISKQISKRAWVDVSFSEQQLSAVEVLHLPRCFERVHRMLTQEEIK